MEHQPQTRQPGGAFKKLDMKKLEFLYHGSQDKNVAEFEPRKETYRDKVEGPAVFATPDLALASCFMLRDCPVYCGKFNDTTFLVADKDRLKESDKGGSIYWLPSATFVNHQHKGMGENEWLSFQKVKPAKKIDYDSALEAMIEHGVQVYLVDGDKLKKIKKAKDNGFSIIQSLESENQKRGKNIRSYDD